MRPGYLTRWLLTITICFFASPVWGQAGPNAFAPERNQEVVPASGSEPLTNAPPPPRYPLPLETTPPAKEAPSEEGVWRQGLFDYTFLPGLGHSSLQINDFQLNTTIAVPVASAWAPVTFLPNFAAHLWQGTSADAGGNIPDLPSHLFDASLEIGWRPRPVRWFIADLALTPGLFTDLKTFDSDAFQLRGRAVGVVAFSPQFQLVGGGLYVNRIMTKFLPAGGFIWNPNDDTKLFAVFPQPKLARRVATFGETKLWTYLSGEFGGGKWAFQGEDNRAGIIDYTDWRIILGLEWLNTAGLKARFETGYVFNRVVRFRGDMGDLPNYQPDATWMVRAGIFF